MTLKQWVKQNRKRIDEVIREENLFARINDRERELWVINNEYLYFTARKEGADI